MNITMLGHIDAGKSTTIGRLLYDSGAIPESRKSEVQKLIEEYKRRFEFGYFLDAFQEELEEERTIDTTRVTFTSGRHLHTIVDVPGHKEFIKNMLTGACNAEVGILIVDVTKGIEEQTRRHAFLAKMLGIKMLIVCINKMDLVKFQQGDFCIVRDRVEDLLKSLELRCYQTIPISALTGEGIYKDSKEALNWITMAPSTLVDCLDAIQEVELKGLVSSKLRVQVQGAYKDFFFAKLLSEGTLSKKEITFMPSGTRVQMDAIPAYPGTCLELKTKDGTVLTRGEVGGEDIKVSTVIDCEVVLLSGKLKRLENLTFCCGTAKVPCKVYEISDVIDPGTGELLKKDTNYLRKDQAGKVFFNTEPIAVERFSECPELGRFILERQGKQVGLGIIL